MLAISNMMLAHATSDVNSNDLYEHSIDNPMLCVTRFEQISLNIMNLHCLFHFLARLKGNS